MLWGRLVQRRIDARCWKGFTLQWADLWGSTVTAGVWKKSTFWDKTPQTGALVFFCSSLVSALSCSLSDPSPRTSLPWRPYQRHTALENAADSPPPWWGTSTSCVLWELHLVLYWFLLLLSPLTRCHSLFIKNQDKTYKVLESKCLIKLRVNCEIWTIFI